MRRVVVLFLLLGLSRTVAGNPRPDAPPLEAMTLEQAAGAALDAVRAKDSAKLKALADLDAPDPWLVADLLLARSEPDAADALAKASGRAEVKALPAYVAARRGKDVEKDVRDALSEALEAEDADKADAAFSKIDGVASKGDTVLSARLGREKGDLLTKLARPEEAARSYSASADVAAKIGWLAEAGDCFFLAGSSAYGRGDLRLAMEQWQKCLAFRERTADRLSLAGVIYNIAALHMYSGDWKQSLAFHERALQIRKEVKDPTSIAQSLLSLGDLHVELGDLAKALEFHTQALKICEDLHLPKLARALASMGSLHAARGDYPKALEFHERALKIQRESDDKEGAGWSLASLGLTHVALGDPKEGLSLEEEARTMLEAASDRSGVAHALGNSAWIHASRGDFSRALDAVGKGLAIADEIPDAEMEARLLCIQGSIHIRLGDYPRAMGNELRAKKAYEEMGNRSMLANVLISIGEIDRLLGEYAKAMEELEKAQRLAEDAGDQARLAEILHAIGDVYYSLGDYRKALELTSRAQGLHEKLGRRAGVAGCLATLGAIEEGRKDFAAALADQQKALKIMEELGDRPGIAFALCKIALAHVALGEADKGLSLLERSQRIRGEMKDRYGIAVADLGFGDAYRALKDPAKALSSYEKAGLSAESLQSPELQVDALMGSAEANLDLGQAALALKDARQAAQYAKNLAKGQGEEQGAAARAQYARLYEAGARAATALGNVQEAAFFLETGRAGGLLESLGGREALESASLAPELLEAETKARAAESGALRDYNDAYDAGNRSAIQAKRTELDAARAGLQEVIERITRESKSAIGVYFQAATLEEMQGWLEPADALVLYWLLPEEALALVVTAKEARIVRLGKTSDVEAACEALALSDPKSDPAKAIDALKDLVVKKLALPEKTARVIVSSDGALSYVPFALLLPDMLVAYSPSGTAYGTLRQERKSHGAGVLALGDPDYHAADEKAVALVRGGMKLVQLPGTRAEAKAIASTAGDVLLLGADATTAALKEAVAKRPRWHALHLGCHGLVDPENPMRCSLALTPKDPDGGFLTAQDLCRMKLPTDLAVLSACETMKGKIYRGEGIVGISRMFLYAGASRLIVSLWKVDDDATHALMTKFYEGWNPKDGSKPLGTAAALAAAQDYVKKQEKWKHPYFWAAWVLWGLPD